MALTRSATIPPRLVVPVMTLVLYLLGVSAASRLGLPSDRCRQGQCPSPLPAGRNAYVVASHQPGGRAALRSPRNAISGNMRTRGSRCSRGGSRSWPVIGALSAPGAWTWTCRIWPVCQRRRIGKSSRGSF
jgi:hypothetical protein